MSVAIFGFEIAVGGGDHADIHFGSLIAAHGPDFLLLQDPQQLGLHLQGQFADLIEKDRAAVRRLEQASL